MTGRSASPRPPASRPSSRRIKGSSGERRRLGALRPSSTRRRRRCSACRRSARPSRSTGAATRSGSIIFEHILSVPDHQLSLHPDVNFKQAMAVGAWYLWWIRRQITHNEAVPPSWRWPISVLSIIRNFQSSSTRALELPETKWSKPDPGFTKLNVDAAFFVDEGMGATSVVLRDGKGNFIACQCKFIPFAANAITTEALAMRDGLLFANSLGFNRIEAESDSLQVINFCTGHAQWWDEAVAVFAECVDTVSSIGKVVFKHCLRSCNQAAHVLANFSFCNKYSLSWLDEPPDCLVKEIVDDVNVISIQ